MFAACTTRPGHSPLFFPLHVPDVYMKNASLNIDLYAAAIVKKEFGALASRT